MQSTSSRLGLRLQTLFATLLLTLGAVSCLTASDLTFAPRTAEVEGQEFSYRVFIPSDWTAEKQWPVILFLHGAGERGSDNSGQLAVGLGPMIEKHKDTFPAVVVMPQTPRQRGAWWGAPEIEAQVLAALDHSMREFNGDPDRVYLTGLSMGGYGTWALAYKHPDRFAALAPVCGGVKPPGFMTPPDWHPASVAPDDPYAETARVIKDIPVWIFHGGADRLVPANESRLMHEALETAGAQVRYSEYAGVGHNSWDQAYSEDEFLTWLLSQKR
ncbi:MAG TPA: prolyl oligopeptidase family serine peptidase [Acidobacteriota bacterium]|nr:prolyl oligopeptidase family serine peptidase [Acidobacteriota bacterium]